jgi:hypothetical protein
MVIDFAPIPITQSSTFFGCLTTDAFTDFCLLLCLTDSNELFLVIILVLSYLLVSLNFSLKLFPTDTRGLEPIYMEVYYRALLFMPVVISQHLLNVFVHLANKRGLKKKEEEVLQ